MGADRIRRHPRAERTTWSGGARHPAGPSSTRSRLRRERETGTGGKREYRDGPARHPTVTDRAVILVDDGARDRVDDGGAAVLALRQKEKPAEIVVAVPVGAPETCAADMNMVGRTPRYVRTRRRSFAGRRPVVRRLLAGTTDGTKVREFLAAAAEGRSNEAHDPGRGPELVMPLPGTRKVRTSPPTSSTAVRLDPLFGRARLGLSGRYLEFGTRAKGTWTVSPRHHPVGPAIRHGAYIGHRMRKIAGVGAGQDQSPASDPQQFHLTDLQFV